MKIASPAVHLSFFIQKENTMKNSTIRRYTFLLLTLCTVASVAQNAKYVNLFIGTSGDNGQVAPGAAAPFGMVCVCPDNDPRSHAGYD